MEIILKKADFQLGILPQIGGALSFFKYKEDDLLRHCSAQETEANNTALFPMLPYTSFIRDNHFPYFGITRHVKKNSPVSNFAIHGDVWRAQGEVVEQNENAVRLKFTHLKTSGFPFNYTAFVTYTLNENGLAITLKLENNSALPMPYGMGIHPFFLKDKSTKIQYNSSYLWYREGDPILGHPYVIPKNLDFQNLSPLPKEKTDISVSGWDGKAIIQNKNYQLEISADSNFRHLILCSHKSKDYFNLEPVTNTPDAFNLASQGIVGTGIQSLGPRESAQTTIQINVKGTL